MGIPFQNIIKELKNDREAKQSSEFLFGNRENLTPYDGLMDLAHQYDYELNDVFDGFEYHFVRLRNKIRTQLTQNSLFIGGDVIEELIFVALKNEDNPISSPINFIKNFKLHEPGFVIYPLHSFGILGFGFLRVFNDKLLYYSNKDKEIAISAQANSKKYLLKFLDKAKNDLDLNKKIDVESIEHFLRSRPIDWLINNPIMIQKVRSYTGYFYSNQYFLTLKLELSLAFIYAGQSLLKNSSLSKTGSQLSTKSLNNFETFDLKHYLLFLTKPGSSTYYDTRCIPMNFSKTFLNEISELNVEFHPTQVVQHHLYNDLLSSFLNLEVEYLSNFDLDKNRPKPLRYHKLFTSIRYFRRSFIDSYKDYDSIVNLCISFELLLLESKERFKKTEPVIKKLGKTLKYRKSKQEMIDEVEKLFYARNEVVHSGGSDKSIDLMLCRKAFVLSFIKLSKKVNYGPINNDTIVTDIIKQVCN